MNTTTTLTGVERVSVNESRAGYDPDGRRYWTRSLVCHGGGKTHTLVLHAEAEDAVKLHCAPNDLDACLAGLSTADLDDLIAAAKTERMSRDPEPAPGCEPDGVCGQCGEPAVGGVCIYSGCPAAVAGAAFPF